MRLRTVGPLLAAFALANTACWTNTQGVDPPLAAFHYPIAGTISPDSRFLYVINSDFDLAYSGGTVNIVDLDRVRAEIRTNLAMGTNVGPPGNESRFLLSDSPGGPDAGVPPPRGSVVQINPFATAAGMVAHRLPDNSIDFLRLYATVRGDGTLTWIDIRRDANGTFSSLECGQPQPGQGVPLCAIEHRTGHDPARSGERNLILPPLPTALSVHPDGFIAIVHQETPRARASLFFDPLRLNEPPKLAHWLGDLSANLSAVLRVPSTPADPRPYWYALSRNEPVVNRVRAEPDGARSYLFRPGNTLLPGLASDVGIRQITRDPCNARFAYATSRSRPADSNSVSRSGDQLLKFDIADPDNPVIADVMVMPSGPSNLTAISPTGVQADGTCDAHTLVYVISYDERKVYVIDANDWSEVGQIPTQPGPHVLIPDPKIGDPSGQNDFIYLLDFSSMCIEVIDVGINSPNRHRVVFTIGEIVQPRVTL